MGYLDWAKYIVVDFYKLSNALFIYLSILFFFYIVSIYSFL